MNRRRYDFVMAVFPNARGIAYVVFEGPQSPVDWGMSDPRGDTRKDKAVRYVATLLDRYMPRVLITQGSCRHPGGARAPIQASSKHWKSLQRTKGVPNVQFSSQQLRQSFGFLGSPTRYAIVEAIARAHPAIRAVCPASQKDLEDRGRTDGVYLMR